MTAHISYERNGLIITGWFVDAFMAKSGNVLCRKPGEEHYIWIKPDELIEYEEKEEGT